MPTKTKPPEYARSISPGFTPAETDRLNELESVVERGLASFIEVGSALAEIRETKLYRKTHDTFEAYLDARWSMSRQHGYRLMDAAEVVASLSPIGAFLPANESQARPLAGLPAEERGAAWSTAVETAPQGKITAEHVEAAVGVQRIWPEENPFDHGSGRGQAIDADSRIRMVANFDAAQLDAALAVPGLQKTVRDAIERKQRQNSALATARFKPGDLVEHYWPALKMWQPATFTGYRDGLAYCRVHGEKEERGSIDSPENYRPLVKRDYGPCADCGNALTGPGWPNTNPAGAICDKCHGVRWTATKEAEKSILWPAERTAPRMEVERLARGYAADSIAIGRQSTNKPGRVKEAFSFAGVPGQWVVIGVTYGPVNRGGEMSVDLTRMVTETEWAQLPISKLPIGTRCEGLDGYHGTRVRSPIGTVQVLTGESLTVIGVAAKPAPAPKPPALPDVAETSDPDRWRAGMQRKVQEQTIEIRRLKAQLADRDMEIGLLTEELKSVRAALAERKTAASVAIAREEAAHARQEIEKLRIELMSTNIRNRELEALLGELESQFDQPEGAAVVASPPPSISKVSEAVAPAFYAPGDVLRHFGGLNYVYAGPSGSGAHTLRKPDGREFVLDNATLSREFEPAKQAAGKAVPA